MATYRGAPFEAGLGPGQSDLVLFAACPPPEDLGFEPAAGHWRKQVTFADVQAVWESRPVGTFGGERCIVLDDLGDRLHIGYLGHDGFAAAQLGYWQVDRGVFELVAPRAEVTDVAEERTDVAVPSGPAPEPAPAGLPAAGGYLVPAPGSSGFTFGPHHPSGPIATFTPGSALPGSPAALPAHPPAVPDSRTGVTLPPPVTAPLPLEAQAMRAAARRPRPARAPAPEQPAVSAAPPAAQPHARPQTAEPARRARPARPRLATGQLFADLAGTAGLPASSWSVGAEADGAMCLMPAGPGYEVFRYTDGTRHERQEFATEEAACFYLFGVLTADAVQAGTLVSAPAAVTVLHPEQY